MSKRLPDRPRFINTDPAMLVKTFPILIDLSDDLQKAAVKALKKLYKIKGLRTKQAIGEVKREMLAYTGTLDSLSEKIIEGDKYDRRSDRDSS